MSKRRSPLKVYRTAIGFHDAYVAAPSQKAALEAWGTDKNLFARGVADVVTDAALTAEPLAAPGKVIKRSRGDLAEQLAADPAPRKSRPERNAAAKPSPRRPAAKPKPRPSRDELTAAEAALQDFEMRAAAEIAAFRRREDALRQERAAAERAHDKEAEKLARRVSRENERYRQALDRWRADDRT